VTTATHTFLSWVREGLATALGPAGPDQTGRAALSVGVTLNTGAVEVAGLHLLGPGDVTGIDRSQVLRTDPPHLAGSCEADHFAAVEFDQPSLPWLLTPGREDASGRLRPWMCLVVVRKQDGVTIAADPLNAVTVLRVAPPAAVGAELPDLADSWAWAHAQVAGPAADPAAAVRDAPDRCLSRLLCPRPLQPSTPYLACVVPTFAAGRAAGLGEPAPVAPASPVDPAWLQSDTDVRLPVYYSWEFVTGPAGDFSALARRLRGLQEVGLGYLRLGQSATTLSGGEAQRLKIAAELGSRLTTDFLYVLVEPTTGRHHDDVMKLLAVLLRLVDAGNTIVVVEHHLDVIKCADWVIDLGPEGGDAGGEIVAEGPPEAVAQAVGSYTGKFLGELLRRS